MTDSLLIPVAVETVLQLFDIKVFALGQPAQQLLVTDVATDVDLSAIAGRQQRNLCWADCSDSTTISGAKAIRPRRSTEADLWFIPNAKMPITVWKLPFACC